MSFEPLIDRLLIRTVGRNRARSKRFLALAVALGVGLFLSVETVGIPVESGWGLVGLELLPIALLSFGLAAYSAYSNGGVLVSFTLVAAPAFAIAVQQNPYFLTTITPPPDPTFVERAGQSVRPALLALGWLGFPAFLLGTGVRHLRRRQPADG